jgi:carbon-monoxide dehydrogenase medium subunit/xanthine dehydrogenase FAD-binding subunit
MMHARYGREQMKSFEYIRCESVEAACAALDTHAGKARILAGGTDLLLELRRTDAPPAGIVVDISRVAQLRGIWLHEGEIRIGPLTTHAELSRSDVLRSQAGFLAVAAGAIGSPQIRNRGTVGGNIMNAATCADTVPPLVALGARLTLRSVQGERVVNIEDFFERPYKTVARENEVLTLISFRPVPAHARTAFVKLGRRNALSIARLSVAAMIAKDPQGIITEARIVPGAALPVWKRITESETSLIGAKPSALNFAAAGRKASEAMVEMTGRRWSTEYKEPVLAVLVRRALEICYRDGNE